MARHEFKTCQGYVTKIDGDMGIVEHLITTFGVLDGGNDISHPGSFTKTLTDQGVGRIRVLDSHNDSSVLHVLGKPLKLWEVDRAGLPAKIQEEYPEATGGLMAVTKFLMDTPEGKGAFVRIKEGAISEWSYAYDAKQTDISTVKDKDGRDVNARNLRQIRLYEYSPVLFGMNPATGVIDAKAGSEGKPGVDVGDENIRIRQRDPGDFQQDSLRTITIGKPSLGVQAVVGKLEGETTTTIQTYIFDKEKWTAEEAAAWVEEHKSGLSLTEQIRNVEAAFRTRFYPADEDSSVLSGPTPWVTEVREKDVIVSLDGKEGTEWYLVPYTRTDAGVEFAGEDAWIRGKMQFVAEQVAPATETQVAEPAPEAGPKQPAPSTPEGAGPDDASSTLEAERLTRLIELSLGEIATLEV